MNISELVGHPYIKLFCHSKICFSDTIENIRSVNKLSAEVILIAQRRIKCIKYFDVFAINVRTLQKNINI